MPATRNLPATATASVQSALLIVNRPSGTGRSPADLECLQQAFDAEFAPVPQRPFRVTDGHEEVLHITQEFLARAPGPWCLLAGGGGGTTRALVKALLTERTKATIDADADVVRVGVLRLGSGNLIAKRLGVPADPVAGLRELADGLFAGRSHPGWAYRCTFYLPDGSQRIEHGLALGSLGQLARVPAQVESWKKAHVTLVRRAARFVPLEIITNLQYASLSLGRVAMCLLHPGRAELVEVRQAGCSERVLCLAGVLLNFDLPQIPMRAGCQFGEPRLALGLLPLDNWRQLLAALWQWRDLDGRLRRYTITPEAPLDLCYLGRDTAVVALDEDTIPTAARRLTWEVVGPLRFLTGLACEGGAL
jgi:hypothetical protein